MITYVTHRKVTKNFDNDISAFFRPERLTLLYIHPCPIPNLCPLIAGLFTPAITAQPAYEPDTAFLMHTKQSRCGVVVLD